MKAEVRDNIYMKRLNQILFAGVTSFLLLGSVNSVAQDQRQERRGNFDPEEMRQRMMDRYREQLDITNDDEWKAIQPLIAKVNEARMESMSRNMMGFGGGRRRGGGEGGDGNNQRRGGGRNFFGEPSPEQQALEKAVESNASADEIKAKLAQYREAQKAKEAKLQKAQDDLRKVLTVKQEAAAVLAGLLR